MRCVPRLRAVPVLVFALAALVPSAASAAAGDPDTSFDSDGKVSTDIASGGDVAQGVVVQPDGKIVVAGYAAVPGFDYAVVRYRSGGGLDATFSGDGKRLVDFGIGSDSAYGLAIQDDGSMVVVGSAYNGSDTDFGIARLRPGGSLDGTFSGDGRAMTGFGASDEAYGVAIQPNGRIVVIGWAERGTDDFGVLRYKPGGGLDGRFSRDGKLATHFGSGDDVAEAVAVQPDGKIVVIGRASNGSDLDFALARYTARGRLDTTFGGDGRVMTDFGSGNDFAYDVAIQPNGKIVVIGGAHNGSNFDFAIARYGERGGLDTSLSGDGKLVTAFLSGDDWAHGVVLQPNGKIVAAGYATMVSLDFAFARYSSTGTLDPNFSSDGKVTVTVGGGADAGYDVARQDDGKIVGAGSAALGTTDFAVVRLLA